MKDTWLIQRLRRPQEDTSVKMVFTKSVTGLTKEARQELRSAFEFDYMGSAEFEFGAVPDALERIIEYRAKFVTSQVEIPLSQVRLDEWEKSHYRKREGKTVPVFIFCQKDHLEYVKALVRKLALEENSKSLKERAMLRYQFLENKEGYSANIGGWLELDNGFFFFTDETMFRKTLTIFGCEVPAGK